MDNENLGIVKKLYTIEKGSVVIEKAEKTEERIVTAIMTSEDVDLEGEVVKIDGINSKGFIGTVLLNHNRDIALGEHIKLRKSGNKMIATFRIAKEGISQKIDETWELIKDGIIKGISMGFLRLDTRLANKVDIKKYGKLARFITNKSKLIEYSVVTIPSNQASVILAIKSLSLTPKDLGIEDIEETFEQEKENTIEEQIEKEIEKIDVEIDVETKDRIIEAVKKSPTVNMKDVMKYFIKNISNELKESKGQLY